MGRSTASLIGQDPEIDHMRPPQVHSLGQIVHLEGDHGADVSIPSSVSQAVAKPSDTVIDGTPPTGVVVGSPFHLHLLLLRHHRCCTGAGWLARGQRRGRR